MWHIILKKTWRMPVVMGSGRQKGCSSWVVGSEEGRVMWGQRQSHSSRSRPLCPPACGAEGDIWGCVWRVATGAVQLGAVFRVHLMFREDQHACSRCEKRMTLKWFPHISIAFQQLHIFKTSATAELCLLTWHQWQWNALKSLLATNGVPVKFQKKRWHTELWLVNFKSKTV